MERTRILVVSSFTLLREGLCALLSAHPHWQVAGETPDWEAVREQVSRTRPHVVVVDVPQVDSGFEALIHGLRERPQAPTIVVLSHQNDEAVLLRILNSGVQACLSEMEGPGDLVAAIEALVKGTSFLCPAASRALLQGYRRRVRRGTCEDPLFELKRRRHP